MDTIVYELLDGDCALVGQRYDQGIFRFGITEAKVDYPNAIHDFVAFLDATIHLTRLCRNLITDFFKRSPGQLNLLSKIARKSRFSDTSVIFTAPHP